MLAGGAFFLGYDLINEYLFRHHEESNLRPKLIEHVTAMAILGSIGGFMAFNTLNGGWVGFLMGIHTGLLSGWVLSLGFKPGSSAGTPLIYYEADVSPEEKERIEMMDQTEILAFNM